MNIDIVDIAFCVAILWCICLMHQELKTDVCVLLINLLL
jgi:hypothetical protein